MIPPARDLAGTAHRPLARPSARFLPLLAAVLIAACSRQPAQNAAAANPPAPSPSARSPRTARSAPSAPAAAPVETRAYLDGLADANDTFDSLAARHAPGEVVHETLDGGEGTELPGWVLFPAEPLRRVEVYLDDAGAHPATLIVRDHSSWVRADGLRIGLDLRALETLNGRPFAFSGFDWDYGGYVSDWKGGRLAHAGHFAGPVRLCPPDGTPESYPAGDRDFMSDLPAVRAAPPTVCELGVELAARAH